MLECMCAVNCRTCVVPIDCLLSVVQLLEKFVEEYYDQNPISQLGLITIHDKRAEKVSEMSGSLVCLLVRLLFVCYILL